MGPRPQPLWPPPLWMYGCLSACVCVHVCFTWWRQVFWPPLRPSSYPLASTGDRKATRVRNYMARVIQRFWRRTVPRLCVLCQREYAGGLWAVTLQGEGTINALPILLLDASCAYCC